MSHGMTVMMNALGNQDYFRGRSGQGSSPLATSGASAAPVPSQGGNVTQGNAPRGSFSYSSSVEVSFSSDALRMAYSSKTEFSFTYSGTAEIARPAPAQAMQSPGDSAKNILNFVEERLKSLQANGASPEDLQKALDDGLSGYVAGRDQAVDMLKGYGLYQGPIKDGVEQTTALVQKGVEDLAKKYLGTGAGSTATGTEVPPAAPAPVAPAPAVTSSTSTATSTASSNPTPAPNQTPSVDEEPTTPSVSRYRAKLYNEDTLDMTVTTRDGDKVTISISALQALQVNGADWTGMTGFAGLQGDGSLSSVKGMNSQSSLFQVDGQLDDGEKAALDGLIASVMDLADSFYGGDMASALDKASQLQLDPAELSSMALDMTQTRYMRASTATYQDIAGLGGNNALGNNAPGNVVPYANQQGNRRGHALEGLGDYMRNLRELGHRADNLRHPRDFINELFSAAFAQRDAAGQGGPLGMMRVDELHRSLVNTAVPQAPVTTPAPEQRAAA